MRVCIAYNSTKGQKIADFAKALGKGIEKQLSNSVVDIIDIAKDSDKRLTGYSYIVFGSEKTSIFNLKVNKQISHFLKNCGHITGKHTFAFTSNGFNSQKFLNNFMKTIESEGVLLKSSALISSTEEAEVIGSKLHIK
ncbi:MAG: hypothetical protein JXR64_09380 [Spirochaetales bacterium]|nr:hypothetical protein [Spirochaetales bacterium]